MVRRCGSHVCYPAKKARDLVIFVSLCEAFGLGGRYWFSYHRTSEPPISSHKGTRLTKLSEGPETKGTTPLMLRLFESGQPLLDTAAFRLVSQPRLRPIEVVLHQFLRVATLGNRIYQPLPDPDGTCLFG